MSVPDAFKESANLRTLGNYLRGSYGVKSKSGVQHDKRVDYFRGGRLLECLVEENEETPLAKWPKTLPKITDQAVGVAVAQLLIQNNYFHRSEKVPEKKKYLMVSKLNVFEENGYYTWMYEGSKTWASLGTMVLIAVILGFTLLPIWPIVAKKALWYCAVTFLLFILSTTFTRFLIFLVFWIAGYEFWIFPNLFDETMSFYDSFKPVYSLESTAAGQGYYRVALVGGLAAFVAWVMTQPTEFDTFIAGQKSFLDDLYSGNLLADVPSDHKENLDKVRRVPRFEDLLREDFFGEDSKPTEASGDGENNNNNNSSESSEEGNDEAEAEAAAEKLESLMEDSLNEEMDEDRDMQEMLEELTRLEELEESEG